MKSLSPFNSDNLSHQPITKSKKGEEDLIFRKEVLNDNLSAEVINSTANEDFFPKNDSLQSLLKINTSFGKSYALPISLESPAIPDF